MAMARGSRTSVTLLAIAGAISAVAVSGCGSSSHRPVPFPAAAGRTLDQLRAGHPESLVLAPSVFVLDPGPNRFGFALFDPTHKLIYASRVAVYTQSASGGGAQGPFMAHQEPLTVERQFLSRTVAQDPAAARSVYVARVPSPASGKELMTALAVVKDKEVVTTEDQFTVTTSDSQPPRVGQQAIKIHTPTAAQAHGNLSSNDTRVPPAPDLQQVDFAQVLGHKPVVLMFATPGLCQSRVCGPVVDIEEQVKHEIGPRVAFIHMEIYKNNNPTNGLRPQVQAWRLATEPWTFVIDRSGRIAARFEGALSAAELRQAVARVAS